MYLISLSDNRCIPKMCFFHIKKVFFVFLQQYDILFKMFVTFLLRKSKLLIKYFILTFSYIMNIISNYVYQKVFIANYIHVNQYIIQTGMHIVILLVVKRLFYSI